MFFFLYLPLLLVSIGKLPSLYFTGILNTWASQGPSVETRPASRGRGVQLYTGSRLPYILPSSDTRKPGGRGVQLKLTIDYIYIFQLKRI